MAEQNPTGGDRVVPIDLPPAQVLIVSEMLTHFLSGAREDLADHPRLRLKRPGRRRAEAEVWERLLEALTLGHLHLPDAEAYLILQSTAEGIDRDEEWAELSAQHNALHALVDLVGSTPPPSGGDEREGD